MTTRQLTLQLNSGEAVTPADSAWRNWGRTLLLAALSFTPVLGQDLGRGAIFFGHNSPQGDSRQNDTILILATPESSAKELCRVLVTFDSGGYFFTVDPQPEGGGTNLVEFGYEEEGLPFDSIAHDRRWVRVIYGSGGAVLSGWVRTESPRTGIVWWRTLLPRNLLFFRDPDKIHFFSSPNGKERKFRLEPFPHEGNPQRYDYIMRPLKTKGDWLLVRIVTPSDMCDLPEHPRTVDLWIRFLDERGRPQVWFYSRGC